MPRKAIVLEHGLNHVLYKDSDKPIPNNKMLYYKDKALGTLTDIQNNPAGLGTNMVIVSTKTGNNEKVGNVVDLKEELEIDDDFVEPTDELPAKYVGPPQQIKSYMFNIWGKYNIEEQQGTFYKLTSVDPEKIPSVIYVPKGREGINYYLAGGSKQKKLEKIVENQIVVVNSFINFLDYLGNLFVISTYFI
jgi:hypothetical protein